MAKSLPIELPVTVVARAWKDPVFKEKLLSDPKGTLKALGYSFPDDVQINVVEENEDTLTLIIPPKP